MIRWEGVERDGTSERPERRVASANAEFMPDPAASPPPGRRARHRSADGVPGL